MKRHEGERGVVSLLTVMFFIIFISLITVSFIGIVTMNQRQTIDSDLSSSAFAAARSGIEDAKRILLYCRSHPGDTDCNSAVLNDDTCDAFTTGAGQTLANRLAIPLKDGQGVTGGAADYEQYFSCLTIQQDTPYISTTLNEGNGFITPLRGSGQYNQLQLMWSGYGTYADHGMMNGTPAGNWTPYSQWKSAGAPYPPVLQIQLVRYTAAEFSNLDDIEHNAKMIYIVPCAASNMLCSGATKDINTIDARGAAGATRMALAPITYAPCSTTGGQFRCSVRLQGLDPASLYYSRTSLLYAQSTSLQMQLYNNNTLVRFHDVQPWIDATGRANDVFRRLRAQVSYAQDVVTPQHVLESSAPICKDMTVTNDAASSTYNCP